MDSVNDIKRSFERAYKDKTILKIVDYDEEGLYVIYAVPTNRLKESAAFVDNMFMLDKASLQFRGAFQPLMHKPEIFFTLPPDRVVYINSESN